MLDARRVVASHYATAKWGVDEFLAVGRKLFAEAKRLNVSLLTVQLGGMDGKSNDPMFEMMALEPSLEHWAPVVVEPVAINFEALQLTYAALHKEKGVVSYLAEQAVTYDATAKGTCTFCHFNASDSAPEHCQKQPSWVKLQLGTLQCEESMKYFGVNFDSCVSQTKLACGSIDDILSKWDLPAGQISMLQLDVEGFEATILNALLANTPLKSLPPVIHFESKVLKGRDQTSKSTVFPDLLSNMESHGYTCFDKGGDAIAIQLNNPQLVKERTKIMEREERKKQQRKEKERKELERVKNRLEYWLSMTEKKGTQKWKI